MNTNTEAKKKKCPRPLTAAQKRKAEQLRKQLGQNKQMLPKNVEIRATMA